MRTPQISVNEGFKVVVWRPSATIEQVGEQVREQVTEHDTELDTEHDTIHDDFIKLVLLRI